VELAQLQLLHHDDLETMTLKKMKMTMMTQPQLHCEVLFEDEVIWDEPKASVNTL
jgi:hypothetical protein